MTYTHPFIPMIGDDGRPTDTCERCGAMHRAPPPPKPPPRPRPTRQESKPAPRRALTARDVARMAGVGVKTIHQHAARGTMPPPNRVGWQMWWEPKVIEAWLATRPGRGRQPGRTFELPREERNPWQDGANKMWARRRAASNGDVQRAGPEPD